MRANANTPNKASSAINRRLAAAATVVSEARRTIEQGNLVDLSGLETEVNTICEALRILPKGQGESLKPMLVSLAADLDTLTQALTAAHSKLVADIGALGNRQRAVKAYVQKE